MAIEMGQQSMLRSLKPLRSALEKLQDTPEAEQLFKEMKFCSKTSNHEDSMQISRCNMTGTPCSCINETLCGAPCDFFFATKGKHP